MNNTTPSKPRAARKLAAAALSGLISFPWGVAVPAARAVTLDGIKVSPDRVEVKLSGQADYDHFTTANPPRVVLQVMGAEYQAGARSLSGRGRFLKSVRSGQFQRNPSLISRVVLDLVEMVSYTVSTKGDRILVALSDEGSAAAAPAPAAAARPRVAAPSQRTLARVGETGGMTTQASPDLAAIARTSDAGKTAATAGVKDAVAARLAPVRRSPPKPKGDIMSRLPKDKVTLDFDNTDVKDVLQLLAAKAKINIIHGPDVAGALSLHLVDVPFNEAFRTALSMLNLQTMQVGDNILRVLTPAALAKTQTAEAAATKVIQLNYALAADLLSVVNQARTAEGRKGVTIADSKSNALIVTESIEGLAATERLIAQLDVRPKQVLIEVKLVEVGLNNSLHYGIQWDYLGVHDGRLAGKPGTNLVGTTTNPNDPSLTRPLDQNANAAVGLGATARGTGVSLPATNVFGALTLGRITNNYFLSATLTAAAAKGKVKVLSDPKVATLNNQPANINVTTSIPYVTSNVSSTGVATETVTYAVTGIQLTVTPTINADGRITLKIAPNVSQPSATAAGSSTTGAPAIDSRNADTTVLVKDGETIVIGGLISDSVSNQVAKVPILGDIPIIGWLFKKKSVIRNRSELLIFVTPRIMAD